MTNVLRYGVFRLGQIWSVVGDDGQKLGFPTRELALAAARGMREMHAAFGREVELSAQDEFSVFQRDPDRRTARAAARSPQ